MKDYYKKLLLSIGGISPIKNWFSSWQGRACVLCYHRILKDEDKDLDNGPNSYTNMSLSKFSKQMKYLSENYSVVSIEELINHLKGSSKSFKVAVTFDDGYKDNLKNALPILENYDIPATVYVTTNFPEGNTWMWWYEIWDHLKKIENLEIHFSGKNYKWKLGTKIQKISCFNSIRKIFINIPYKQQILLAQIITKNNERKQYHHLCLNWEEIKTLDNHKLFTIGSHTHKHSNLKILSRNEILKEMKHSKFLLEKYLNHPIDHFAFPYGTINEASEVEFELSSICGYKSAVTTRNEPIWTPSLNAIPRIGVPSYINILGFISKISGWEHFLRSPLKGLT